MDEDRRRRGRGVRWRGGVEGERRRGGGGWVDEGR